MTVQNEINVHFVVLIICTALFTIGIIYFIKSFINYGIPTDEALEITEN
jgi:nitric oxide reductase subunit B